MTNLFHHFEKEVSSTFLIFKIKFNLNPLNDTNLKSAFNAIMQCVLVVLIDKSLGLFKSGCF